MLLFDEMGRDDHQPKTELESSFDFLNRSARPAIGKVRDEIEKWLENYPVDDRNELIARIRDDFDSPWYELFLHQMFLAMGAQMTIHPDVGTRGKCPEFQVVLNGEKFILEATLFTEESTEQKSRNRSLGYVFDEINKMNVPFFLHVGRVECPKNLQIAPTRVIAFLRRELGQIDPDELVENIAYDQMPQLIFVDNETSIEFRVLPKSKAARKKKSRVIGMRTMECGPDIGEVSLRKILEGKGRKYGQLEQPFLISVNTLGTISLDRDELRGALFGRLQEYVSARSDKCLIRHRDDGFWGTERNPKYTRVSGVLLGMALPWNVPKMELTLFKNPWARFSLPEVSWPFKVVTNVGGEFRTQEPDIGIRTLFNLAQEWPGNFFKESK